MSVIRSFTGAKGGGGGGGEAPAQTQTPDNLRSRDTVEVVLGISEGKIRGLADGNKSFEIGETPLQNANGDYNFQNFELIVYPGDGLASETVTPKLGGQARSHTVSTPLMNGTPVTRQTLFGNIQFIDVRIAFSRLYLSNSSGVFNHSVEFKIEYKAASAATYTNITPDPGSITITGKTTSTYIKNFRFAVPSIGEPYDVKVTKISPDSDSVGSFRDIVWESYQEVIAGSVTHADLAMVHLVGQSSDQFSSLPGFRGVYDGIIMHVPSNYDPDTRVYTGIWDLSWQMNWTNNGAYFLHEFVTNTRWGMSNYFPVVMDKSDIYEAGQWCDEMVPDGAGGVEPRFTFNTLISDARNGKEMAKFIAGTFNGVFFDDQNGTARLKVDKDDPAIHLFTRENVIDGQFRYSYTDVTTRYNDIIVTFTNPDLNWIEDRRRVHNQVDIDLNGRVPFEFPAVGCTGEREALRRATYKLLTGLTECEMVSFRTNRLAHNVRPFDVMLIGDANMGYSKTGRVRTVSVDRMTVNLRDPIYFEVGIDYVMRFVTPSEDVLTRNIVIASTGLQSSFDVDEELPDDLPDLAVFSIEQAGAGYGSPKPYRVMLVEEVDGHPDQFEIMGIEINRNKWNDVDNLTSSGTVQYSALPNPTFIPSPTSVGFATGYFRGAQQNQLFIEPLLDRVAYPFFNGDFEVYSRLVGGGAGWAKQALVNGDTIIGHPEGNYQFKVLPRNYLGGTATLATATVWPYEVEYDIPEPSMPTGLIVRDEYTGLRVQWAASPEPDIEFYELLQGSSVDSATVLLTNFLGTRFTVPKTQPGPITFLLRSYAAGKYSAPATVTFDVPRPTTVQNFLVVQNLNSITFRWDRNPEPDILHYEIREGLTWKAGQTIAQVQTTFWQMPSNIEADRTFWIKAVNRATFRSANAAQAVAEFIPLDNVNIVKVEDEKTSNWPGVKINTSEASDNLILDDGKSYGEYIHPMNLAAEIYARNVLDMTVDAVETESLTWATATFPWNSASAARPWVHSASLDSVSFEQMISTKVGLGAGEVEGFPLNDTLVGEDGTTAAASVTTYAPGRFRNGALITDLASVGWNIAVPAEFRLQVWIRPQLVDEDVGLLTLSDGAGNELALRYEAATSRFYLEDPANSRVYASAMTIAEGDVLLATIIQTDAVRRLFIGRLHDEAIVTGSASITPVGAFTSLYLQ